MNRETPVEVEALFKAKEAPKVDTAALKNTVEARKSALRQEAFAEARAIFERSKSNPDAIPDALSALETSTDIAETRMEDMEDDDPELPAMAEVIDRNTLIRAELGRLAVEDVQKIKAAEEAQALADKEAAKPRTAMHAQVKAGAEAARFVPVDDRPLPKELFTSAPAAEPAKTESRGFFASIADTVRGWFKPKTPSAPPAERRKAVSEAVSKVYGDIGIKRAPKPPGFDQTAYDQRRYAYQKNLQRREEQDKNRERTARAAMANYSQDYYNNKGQGTPAMHEVNADEKIVDALMAQDKDVQKWQRLLKENPDMLAGNRKRYEAQIEERREALRRQLEQGDEELPATGK